MVDMVKTQVIDRDPASEDLAWVEEGRPLWWDDASYIRYQSDCGPEGIFVTNLSLYGDGAPLEREFIYYEYLDDEARSSRAWKLALIRFNASMRDLAARFTPDWSALPSIPF